MSASEIGASRCIAVRRGNVQGAGNETGVLELVFVTTVLEHGGSLAPGAALACGVARWGSGRRSSPVPMQMHRQGESAVLFYRFAFFCHRERKPRLCPWALGAVLRSLVCPLAPPAARQASAFIAFQGSRTAALLLYKWTARPLVAFVLLCRWRSTGSFFLCLVKLSSPSFGNSEQMYGVAGTHPVLEAGGPLAGVRGAATPLRGAVSPLPLGSYRWRKQARPCGVVAALDPAFPNQQPDFGDFQWPLTSRVGRGRSQGESESRGEVKAGAKEKWSKHNESALSGDSPLSLPMAYPGLEPATQKEIDAMSTCNPEKEFCKDPVYEWTAKCSRCQGTGEVSFYRKRGKEVISKCIACVGIGYVQKITSKAEKVDDSDSSK